MKLNKKNIEHDAIIVGFILFLISLISLCIFASINYPKITEIILIVAAGIWLIIGILTFMRWRYLL